MSTHLSHLEAQAGPLKGKRVLDLGCGTGWFLIDAANAGIDATGLESSHEYIKKARAAAAEAGVTAVIVHGVAEALPFPDASFDFANVNEVIEHVENPERMLEELRRVLIPGGRAYLSVPNRFGFKDQHFHLYLVNWLPRSVSDVFISVFGRHKDYAANGSGRQRLKDMHYYRFGGIQKLLTQKGFEFADIRAVRVAGFRGLKGLLARLAYPVARTVYLDAFHLVLTRPRT